MKTRQAFKLMTRATPRQKWSTLIEAARITEIRYTRKHPRLMMKAKKDLLKLGYYPLDSL